METHVLFSYFPDNLDSLIVSTGVECPWTNWAAHSRVIGLTHLAVPYTLAFLPEK